MRRLLVATAAIAALALVVPPAARGITLPVETRTLRNGLRVLVHPDHSAPVVSSYIFFRAGSRNEHYGTTGIAHLFEHMMFNGGKRFGPGVFDDTIEQNGGSTNGYTTRDYTAYLNNFPREALPIILDLESDRMANLAITPKNLEQERGIVMEERRLRIDNDVQGAMNEALYLQAYVRSPYRWNTVGFMEDLKLITLDEARAYFHTYYAPNNATLVLVGDIEPSAGFALAERYFGAIPRRPPPAPVHAEEPEQNGERRIIVRRQAELPSVLIGYKAVRAADPDRPALDVATRVLSGGESSRLDRDLVREHEVATQVDADLDWGIDLELLSIHAQARPGRTAKDLVDRIDVVLADLGRKLVPPDELAKAKRQLRAELVRSMKTVSGKANQLGFFETVLGDYRALFGLEDAWDAVTAEDVQRVAQRYLVPTGRTIVVLEPTQERKAAK
ncbi:MAG TPA: pitrilysin family protein [Candidatus Eisenbacteria bacterium]|nr:pitrilysin family protein [Candidatus Eisenbacteria bacterium]